MYFFISLNLKLKFLIFLIWLRFRVCILNFNLSKNVQFYSFGKNTKKNATFSLTFRKMVDKICIDVYTTIRLYGGFIMNFKEINKDIPIPVYYQLKEIIREKIEIGELKIGEKITSENKLSEIYQISRMTVRQAIKELVGEGLLYRDKGRGTFVCKPKINYGFIQKLTTFYDDMVEKGYIMRTKILKQEIRTASKTIAEKLSIEENEKIIYIFRIRDIENDPIASVINNIPYKLCPGLINEDLTDKSLYRVLAEKYGLVAYKARITLEAIIASKYDSELLNIKEGAPVHLMKNITYTKENIVMDYFESHFRGDKGKITVELYR